ncbi:MAG: PadR family transcriptional regulator [Jiangellaceae bacterium]
MSKRKVSNPLALAVLGLLTERSMHPYEMSTTLRERAMEQSIKLNYGSLYSVVETLQQHELIEVQETVREGRRPERTIYAITDAGRTEFVDWLSELLAMPVKEYTQFEAALSMAGALPPDEVVRLLQTRRTRLKTETVSMQAMLDDLAREGLPEVFVVEAHYALTMRAAELSFVERLIATIEDGSIGGLELWRRAHETGQMPTEADWKRPEVKLRTVE